MSAEETNEILALANTDGEEIALPKAFQAETKKGIKLFNKPRDWRTMVEKSAGFFQANNENMGPKLAFRVLDYRTEDGILFAAVYKDPETVVQAIIIDQHDVVGTIVFRTSSMENFLQMADNVAAKGEALATKIINAEMVKKKTKSGFEFHLVEFVATDNTKEGFKEICDFVQLMPQALTCYRDLPKHA